MSFVAVVFGASGISGWSITNTLLQAETPDKFACIIALTKQTLTQEESGFPIDSRLSLCSGIDLQEDLEVVIDKLKKTVPNIEKATHVFYTAFCTSDTDNQLVMKAVNTKMLATAVRAVDAVAGGLSFVGLQTGSNHYGILFAEVLGSKFGRVPLKEDLPRLPPPLSDSLMFYSMVDEMKELSNGARWTWCDIRPDMIIGHPPRPNSHSIAESVGSYLAFHAFLTPGGKVPFPGSVESWTAKFNYTGQDVLGKFAVHLSHVEHITPGEAFNIANKPITSWGELWGLLARYWGLEGTEPSQSGKVDVQGWIITNMDKVKLWEAKYDLIPGRLFKVPWRYFEWALSMRVDRQLELSKSKAVGFQVDEDHVQSFEKAWHRMQRHKYLPVNERLYL